VPADRAGERLQPDLAGGGVGTHVAGPDQVLGLRTSVEGSIGVSEGVGFLDGGHPWIPGWEILHPSSHEMDAAGVFDVPCVGALTKMMSNEGPGITRSPRHVTPCHSGPDES
jgi:hypothetical protein